MSEIIGNTPMLEIPIKTENDWRLLLKLEKFNPGQSMKDRMALNMINQAENDGRLQSGGTIIESSSGNTATGLALVAAERGYRFIAVVDHHAAKDKIAIIKAYGGEIRFVDSSKYKENEVAVKEREILAAKLAQEIPNSIFLQQADNPANADAYYKTLGQEIIDETRGELSILIGSVGTGGSLSGTARRLKEHNPTIQVVGIEPYGSVVFGGPNLPYFQSGTGNPWNVEIGKNVNYSIIDRGMTVTDREAFNTARYFARKKGILVGGAAGGIIYKAIEIIREQMDTGILVAIIADGGEKYLDTVFNDEWMSNRELIDLDIEEKIKNLLNTL
ncbi:MAG: PLP-dependent cysteine synthase family protein [Candidatus Electronema sp. VV]